MEKYVGERYRENCRQYSSGKHAGKWYDFSSGEGGDLFDLARKERGGDFVKAKEYLTSMVGMSTYNESYYVV
ncbi:hypothetical protein [Orientia tsutsugamushi]|uniref:hypothetical protein n=1 Tax=Orientia tsutsugamushi TaxID=784 RepID=UPI0002EA8FCB|nr:hypothetical protein [Orientia tsutsugamushi]